MTVEVEFEKFIRDSDNAALVELPDGREVWLPFSHVEKMLKRPDGSGSARVSDWLARKEDL